jgi:hypothetical protein
MKSRHLSLGLLLAVLAAGPTTAPPAAAQATTSLEAVTNLTIAARLTSQDTLDITEQIDYDFAGNVPHDITANFPAEYQDDQGRNYHLGFQLLGATRGQTPLQLKSVAPPGQFSLPADRPPYHYQLHYQLGPIVIRGPQGDVFKVAIGGGAWPVTVNQATVTLQTPGLDPQNLTCYTGSGPSTTASCTVAQIADTATIATIATTAPLPAGAILGLYGNFRSGSFSRYLQPDQPPFPWVGLLLWIGLPLVGLATSVIALILFLHRRRRQKSDILKPDETKTV